MTFPQFLQRYQRQRDLHKARIRKLVLPLGEGPSEILATFPAICLQEGAEELLPGAQHHPHVYC